jgi:hypothetical protein
MGAKWGTNRTIAATVPATEPKQPLPFPSTGVKRADDKPDIHCRRGGGTSSRFCYGGAILLFSSCLKHIVIIAFISAAFVVFIFGV